MFGSPPLPKASHTEKELDSSKCAQCRNLFVFFVLKRISNVSLFCIKF